MNCIPQDKRRGNALLHFGAAWGVAQRIRVMEERPVPIGDGRTVAVTISIGVTMAPDRQITLDQLLATADKALYDAKAGGRNRTAFAATSC
ncbi:diguanylate cyclase [Luteimonas sp. BDR2-5]|uniref:GGDEF domain-containing protein n=1 Tax=Proluteimonas luteida TaxID=2878685 RepID=UPI0021069847|nr:diguanylate cyclase [Luteimonas sp. BDR2-5]MCD9026703.1 diguanylate cyclase [Luteimonas sp. BDR2-5]